MAGLKMNFEFPTRLCEVKGELGYFHLWEQWSNVVDAVMWFLLQKISDFLWFFAKFSICMILWYIIHG